MAYLRGRCIHPNVLAFCRREGILYQTSFKNHPNCVFVGRDGEGVAKGRSLRGCTQLQFRRDIPGSKKIYPFYIAASGNADTVEVYEAPIDAMSGASLKLMQHTGPWRSVHYLALGGTDYAALDAFLKYFPPVRKIVLSETPSVLSGINRIQRWSQSKPLYLVFLLSSCQYIVFLWKGRGDIRNKHPFGHEAGCSPLPGSVNSGTRK